MRKIGSRRVEVDGQTYLWRVRRSPTYAQAAFATALTFTVQHAGGGSVLVVTCDRPRPDNWLGRPGVIVTPAIVAACIREATAGWCGGASPSTAPRQEWGRRAGGT